MFWDNFIKLCNQINKSPTSVISDLGISRGSVTHWKSGKVPHHDTLLKIANHFDVTVDYLLGKTDDPTAPELKSNASDTLPITVTQHNATGETQAEQTEPLTEQEKTILRLFRETTEEGRMRMIQSIFNIHDSINKSTATGEHSSLA